MEREGVKGEISASEAGQDFGSNFGTHCGQGYIIE